MTLRIADSTAPCLRQPDCSVCGRPAEGTVTANDVTDGWCDRHAAAVMAAAILTEPATPPSVEILDVDSYRSGGWSAA